METFSVHKVDDNLVVSTSKLPGFGKLGTATIRTPEAENKLIDLYYAGGFFKRCADEAAINKVQAKIILIAQNQAKRRRLGRVVCINYTNVLRLEKETA